MAEEFLLLSLDPDKGRPPIGRSHAVEPGLAAALMTELVLRGRLEVDRKRVTVVDSSTTGDELLDEALGHLAGGAAKGRGVKGQLKRLDRGLDKLTPRLIARLVGSGVLGEQRRRVLGVPLRRHPVVSAQTYDGLRRHVRTELGRPAGEMEVRAAALVGLLSAAELLNGVFESAGERRAASAHARAAMAANPAAPALRKIVDEVESTAAAVAAGAAGS